MHRFVAFAFFVVPFALRAQVQALPNAHAHNDYEHKRPLLDALDNGFTSVEADVYLIDGELYVAHDRPRRKKTARTLRNLYLKPLQARIEANAGRVYPGYADFFYLMIDIKSNGDSAYQTLKTQLAEFKTIISEVSGTAEERGKPVKVFISGNRPVRRILEDSVKIAALDGRPDDLGKGIPAAWMPVVSDHCSKFLSWKGEGIPLPGELQKLRDFVAKAHAENKKVRLWAAPDVPAFWGLLQDEGVDLINTDKLPELKAFLQGRKGKQ